MSKSRLEEQTTPGLERRFRRWRDTIGVTLAIAGFLFGAYQYWHATKVEAENQELSESNRRITVLDVVTSYTKELPGIAVISKDGKTERVASQNVVLQPPDGPSPSYYFEVNLPAIGSLTAVLDSLVDQKSDDARADFVGSFVLPILFAKCQSQDPTVSAGAISACGHILNSGRMPLTTLEALRPVIASPPVSEKANPNSPSWARKFERLPSVFQNCTFAKVHFGNQPVTLDRFYLNGCDFSGARLSVNASFAQCSLAGTNFSNSECSNAIFDGSMCEAHPDHSIKFTSAQLTRCSFRKCRLPGSNFEKVTLLNCVFADSIFSKSIWNEVHDFKADAGGPELGGTIEFRNCNLEDVKLTNSEFRSLAIIGGDAQGIDLSGTTAQKAAFKDVNMQKAELTQNVLAKATFDGVDLTSSKARDCDLSAVTFGKTGIGKRSNLSWAVIGESPKFIEQCKIRTNEPAIDIDKGAVVICARPTTAAEKSRPNKPITATHVVVHCITRIDSGALDTIEPSSLLRALRALADSAPTKIKDLGLDVAKVLDNDDVSIKEIADKWNVWVGG